MPAGKHQRAALAALHRINRPSTCTELRGLIRTDYRTTFRALEGLSKRGYVRRHGKVYYLLQSVDGELSYTWTQVGGTCEAEIALRLVEEARKKCSACAAEFDALELALLRRIVRVESAG